HQPAFFPYCQKIYATNNAGTTAIFWRVITINIDSAEPRTNCQRGRSPPSVRTNIHAIIQATSPWDTASLYTEVCANDRANTHTAIAAQPFPPNRRAVIQTPINIKTLRTIAKSRPTPKPGPNHSWIYPGIKKASGALFVQNVYS